MLTIDPGNVEARRLLEGATIRREIGWRQVGLCRGRRG